MGNRIRSVTKETYDKLEYEVGIAAINLDITAAITAADIREIIKKAKLDRSIGVTDNGILLGVTRGGINLTVSTEWLEVKFDDNPGPSVGSTEKGLSTVTFTFTILEATPENTAIGMGTADIDIDTIPGVTIVQERDYIDILKDYSAHFYVITRQGKDKITVLEADNVISMGGYNETKNDAGQTEIAITMQATLGDMDSEGELPYRKLFFGAEPVVEPIP